MLVLIVMLRFAPTVLHEFGEVREAMKIRGFLKSVGNVLRHPMDTLEYAIVPMVFRSLKIADELAASAIVRGIESPYKKESYYVSRIAVLDCVLIIVSVGAAVCCCLYRRNGMGKELYENDEDARKIYDRVKEITGIDIAKISFEGPEELLNQTKYTQLAILTNSLAELEVLKKQGIKAEISAGLSLGEYTALIYSKALSFEDGVKLVQKRGEFMQDLAPKGNWQMAAILGAKDENVESLCKKVSDGFAVPVNYNCPGQVCCKLVMKME